MQIPLENITIYQKIIEKERQMGNNQAAIQTTVRILT